MVKVNTTLDRDQIVKSNSHEKKDGGNRYNTSTVVSPRNVRYRGKQVEYKMIKEGKKAFFLNLTKFCSIKKFH